MSLDPVTRVDPADLLIGPDELAQEVIADRGRAVWSPESQGAITEVGVRRLIRIAYHAGQLANEARYPRFTLFVPAARGDRPRLNATLSGPLTVSALRRLGPVLESSQLGLVVEERDDSLCMVGVASLAHAATELTFGDPIFAPQIRYRGLVVEIMGPGDIRAGEWYRRRLVGGVLRQEQRYFLEPWFLRWADPAVRHLLNNTFPENPNFGLELGILWEHLILRITALHHGGCLVILPDPCNSAVPIRPNFQTTGCDLGAAFAGVWLSVHRAGEESREFSPVPPTTDSIRGRLHLRQVLLSTIDTIAHLSATDGCLVFDRNLNLHSFGSMIEPPAGTGPVPPCFTEDSSVPLSAETLQGYGARRRSAILLCQTCPGAMAFIVSQDGDLRAVVRHGEEVRLYDNLTTWDSSK